MKFRDKSTGAIYEPTAEVAAMMARNPNLEEVAEEPKTAKKAAKKAKE
jgi:hypothetical protein